jgi:hypothetical protein
MKGLSGGIVILLVCALATGILAASKDDVSLGLLAVTMMLGVLALSIAEATRLLASVFRESRPHSGWPS